MTHASDASGNPRSARIDGSATPTIVTSRTIISSPRQRTTSANQRASCARAVPSAPRIPMPGPALTLPLLLRGARGLLVVNDHYARAGGGHARKFQLLLAAGAGEEQLACTEDGGINHEPQLVDETMLQQQPHK